MVTYLYRSLVQNCFRNGRLHISDRQQNHKAMVVLFTWLEAKEKYAHKYVNGWNKIGYDVLEVNCYIRDMLFPKAGTEMTAQRVVDFLDKRDQPAILHGLSVGGYIIGRVLMACQDSNVKITHQINDSLTSYPALEEGVRVAAGPQFSAIATTGINLYKKICGNNSFMESEGFLWTSPIRAPVLYMHSLADKIIPFDKLEHLVKSQNQVAPVETFLLDETKDVSHVQLFKFLGEERYMEIISKFLAKYPNEESWKHNYAMDPDAVPAYKLMETPAWLAPLYA